MGEPQVLEVVAEFNRFGEGVYEVLSLAIDDVDESEHFLSFLSSEGLSPSCDYIIPYSYRIVKPFFKLF